MIVFQIAKALAVAFPTNDSALKLFLMRSNQLLNQECISLVLLERDKTIEMIIKFLTKCVENKDPNINDLIRAISESLKEN